MKFVIFLCLLSITCPAMSTVDWMIFPIRWILAAINDDVPPEPVWPIDRIDHINETKIAVTTETSVGFDPPIHVTEFTLPQTVDFDAPALLTNLTLNNLTDTQIRELIESTTDGSNFLPNFTTVTTTTVQEFDPPAQIINLTEMLTTIATAESQRENSKFGFEQDPTTLVDQFVGYFKYIRDNDADSCVSLIVCESFLDPKLANETKYGSKIVTFFTNYTPNEANRNGWWYKNSAILGSLADYANTCKENFPQCNYNTKDLLQRLDFPY